MDAAAYAAITEKSEMTPEDHAFILKELAAARPTKVLEVGVCAGGTTNLLLRALPREAVLYSVDIAEKYPRDASKNTGYIAEREYDPATQARWVRYFGWDVAGCVEKIGEGIDFVILDTTHVLPGEILSFLAILPFMREKAILVLHDIANHMLHKLGDETVSDEHAQEYCTTLLFSAVCGEDKRMSDALIPNCGAVTVHKDRALREIFMVLNVLFLDWHSMPGAKIMADTLRIVRRFYGERDASLLELAFRYNLARDVRRKAAGNRG